jgi:phosphoglucomutase
VPRIFHPSTGFLVGDPELAPLRGPALPSDEDVARALSSLIVSASGWRKVFAASGREESLEEDVAAADLTIAAAAAEAFAGALREIAAAGSEAPAVLVGIDSRPTGPAIADAMIRAFIGAGLRPRYLFIAAAPEIMAYSRRACSLPAGHEERAEGFCYVSASHNPVGHNGLKFGLASSGGGGGVLNALEAARLAEAFRAVVGAPGAAARARALMAKADPRAVARAFSECALWKRRAVSAYTLLAREVVSGAEDLEAQEALFVRMSAAALDRPVGVVAELNGSARCLSIDRDFLAGMGVRVRSANDAPRAFAHRIVPEGESLSDAMRELDVAADADDSFVAGYVPDCDGDRGNLVARSAPSSRARPIEAQEVFALSCVAELAQLACDGSLSHDDAGNARERVAIAVNDATSMRINAIARAFDADVFRAETGEANVVGLAQSLRDKGYIVRILGEGSNGGNITHPSRVRDPLATLGALVKLLLVRDSDEGEGLYRAWMRLSGRLSDYRPDFGIGDVLDSLPRFATTSVFEPRAALSVRSSDHAALKARYAEVFEREWESRKDELGRRYGIASWEAYATNGQVESRVGADFGASGRGGLRVALTDAAGRPRAFLWMRGSGTEPVFRIMADVEDGLPEDEERLLAWHSSMVRAADGQA